jgi:hypothetical protein
MEICFAFFSPNTVTAKRKKKGPKTKDKTAGPEGPVVTKENGWFEWQRGCCFALVCLLAA